MSLTPLIIPILALISLYSTLAIIATITYFRAPSPTEAPHRPSLLLFTLTLLGGIAIHTHGVYHRLFTPQPSLPPWNLVLILLLQICSHALWTWTRRTVSRNEFTRALSRDVPKKLVTTGPYAYTRNPFYASYLMSFAATAVLSGRGVDYMVLGASYVAYWLVAVGEERKFMQSELRGEYEAFRRGRARFFVGAL
ncbi:hypothetical protein OQA88_10650 [Cercophora sp. LCS_1]